MCILERQDGSLFHSDRQVFVNNTFGRSSLGVEGGSCQNGKGTQIRFCKRREDNNNPPAGNGAGIFV